MELIIEDEQTLKVFKALASKTRVDILIILSNGTSTLDVSRIAEKLNQTEANVSAQIKILEKAGLIQGKYQPGEHGVAKICELLTDKLIVKFI